MTTIDSSNQNFVFDPDNFPSITSERVSRAQAGSKSVVGLAGTNLTPTSTGSAQIRTRKQNKYTLLTPQNKYVGKETEQVNNVPVITTKIGDILRRPLRKCDEGKKIVRIPVKYPLSSFDIMRMPLKDSTYDRYVGTIDGSRDNMALTLLEVKDNDTIVVSNPCFSIGDDRSPLRVCYPNDGHWVSLQEWRTFIKANIKDTETH